VILLETLLRDGLSEGRPRSGVFVLSSRLKEGVVTLAADVGPMVEVITIDLSFGPTTKRHDVSFVRRSERLPSDRGRWSGESCEGSNSYRRWFKNDFS